MKMKTAGLFHPAETAAAPLTSGKPSVCRCGSALKVLHRTALILLHAVCIRGDYPPQKAEALKTCLMDMEKSAEGRKVLKHIQKTARFDEIPKENLENLNQMIPFIAAELDAQ